MLPQEMGCGSGSTCWQRLRDWEEAGVWEELHRVLLDRLGKADEIDWSRASLDSASVPAKGRKTGKNPTDRGKPGSKRHLVSDKGGVPLAVVLTAANIHDDSTIFEEAVDATEPIKGPGGGRPRKRPEKLNADKGYDAKKCRKALRKRRIKSRITRKGVESSERLGRYRWVVERTLAWLGCYRKLTVRYERRADIHEAFLHLGCSLICLNYLS